MPAARQTILQEIDWTCPAFALYVDDTLVAGGKSAEQMDLTQDVISVEFDDSLSLANELAIAVCNADNRYTDNKIFRPGAEVELHLGYGTDTAYVGRGKITRFLPSFPADGIPTLDVKALDPSHRMMKEEFEIAGSKRVNTKKTKRKFYEVQPAAGQAKKQTSGRVWNGTVGSIIAAICTPYGITPRVDPDLAAIKESFPQKKGTSDYDVLRALASLYQAEFFVNWEPAEKHRGTAGGLDRVKAGGKWIAHFRKSREFARQASKIVFKYGGDAPSLISADLQFAIDESVNEVEVQIYDRKARGWKAINVEETARGKKVRYGRGVTAKGGPLGPVEAGPEAEEITDMSLVRLAVEGHSVTVATPRKFRSAQAALDWAKKTIQQNKDAFLTIQGETIGVPDLRSGQTHEIQGIGKTYSGDYYFTQVKHTFNADSGYRCQFSANKVINRLEV
jgi:phage protein D